MVRKLFGSVAFILLFGLISVASTSSFSAPKGIFNNAVEPEATPRINLGRMNYEGYCASCHGKTARGTEKGPTFISRIYHPGHHGDGAFFIAAKRGVRAHHWPFGDMKAIAGITDGQIESIVEYVRSIQKANKLF